MKRLLIALLFAFPAMAGPNAVHVRIGLLTNMPDPQVNTFCASNLSCTLSATWTFANANNVIHVDGTTNLTPEAAVAKAPASPQGYAIYHDRLATTSVGFTIGNTSCPNFLGADFFLDPGAAITFNTLNGNVKLLCNSKLKGTDLLSNILVSGASFTAGPMVDLGDNLSSNNASLEEIRLNCSSLTSNPCVRGRGLNDWSRFDRVFIQNAPVIGLQLDGTTQNTALVRINDSIIGCKSGVSCSDAVQLLNTQGSIALTKNTFGGGGSQQSSAAGLHITGASANQQSPILDLVQHSEQLNDAVLLDNSQHLTGIDIDAGNGVVNGVRIAAASTGSAFLIGTHNNANNVANPTILNQCTATSIGSNNGGTFATPGGIVPYYGFVFNGSCANSAEWWWSAENFGTYHFNGSIASFKNNSTNNDNIEIADTGTTPCTLHFGFQQALSNTFGGRFTSTCNGQAAGQAFNVAFNSPFTWTLPGTLTVGNRFAAASITTGTGGFLPPGAGTADVGSTSLPIGNVWLGTAATNNFKFQPASTTGARIITITDPVSPTTVGLPLTIANSTATMAAGSIAAATCATAITVAATGVATTDSIVWAYATAPTLTTDALLHISPYVTAGNANFIRCNPTAGAIVGTAIVINWRVVR